MLKFDNVENKLLAGFENNGSSSKPFKKVEFLVAIYTFRM
jgi:hypothetical protein